MNDIRIYDYYGNEPLVTRETQAKRYFDKKFANIKVDVDIDLSSIDEKLDTIDTHVIDSSHDVMENIDKSTDKIIENIGESTDTIVEKIGDATNKIIENIEASAPCLCNLATKEDVCHAKCEIIHKINSSKQEIIEDIDEKFVDLNELIKK